MSSQSSSSKSNRSDDNINLIIEKEDAGSGSSTKQRYSRVYQYLTFNESTSRWSCDYCNNTYSDSSTSTLWRHIQKKHPELLDENYEQQEQEDNQGVQKREKCTQQGLRKRLLHWIVADDQPFVTIEKEEFREMVKYLWPDASIPTADTIRSDLNINFTKLKTHVKETLQDLPGLLSFTVDAWTSKNQLPFLGISIHWIDNEWSLKSSILDFCSLSGPHTGENLANRFLEVLHDFNLSTKLLAIGCDNASNMNTMLNKISISLREKNINFNPNNQRVRCLAHIINLAAKQAIENLYISWSDDDTLDEINDNTELISIIYKLRKLVIKVRSSPQRRERFKQQCNATNTPELELIPDVKTRWNSTEMMIERALKLRIALHNLASSDRDLSKYLLSDDEWNCIIEIHKLLQHFKKGSDFITGQLYPTLAFGIPAYNYILSKLESVIANQGTRSEIKNAANMAKNKLEEYYSYTDANIYTIATVLDPRFKLVYYEENSWSAAYILKAKTTVTEIWDLYKNVSEADQSSDTMDDELLSHVFKKRKTEHKDELKTYLSEPTVSRKTDILLWWKLHEVEYPNLSQMAKDYLAIPATSAPVERIFSGGTDLVVQKRCSLNAETIQKCMCLKGWWKSGFNRPIIISDR